MSARRRARLLGLAGLMIGALLVLAAPFAGAQDAASLDDSGWWARTNQDPLLSPAAGPDVTPGQLAVEGAPEGATAIAALRATLPADAGSPVLTLGVVSELGADGAILLACQAGSGWTGAHAGPWAAKPNPDCAQSVQGIASDDGSEWTFALGPLQFGDQLNIVLTPGVDPARPAGLDGSAFRIVFERPSAASIQVSESEGDFSPGISVPDFTVEPPPPASGSGGDFTPSFTPIDSGSSFLPPTLTDDDLAAQPAKAALPTDEQGQTATAPVLGAQNPVRAAAIDDAGDAGRFLGVLVFLMAGGLLAWSNTQPAPERMVLSRFAATATTHAAVTHAAEPTEGGLGRFRRRRDTPARRLGG